MDGGGIHGYFFHYAMIFALVGSSVLFFIYFWRKGLIDMSEDPKYKMLEDEEDDGR